MLLDLSVFDLSSVAAFRNTAIIAKRSGSLCWLQGHGLAIDSDSWHAALCNGLKHFGLGGEPGRTTPQCAVFDWSSCEDTSAEALALFAVLARRLHAKDVAVFACEPGVRSVSEVLSLSGIRSACADVRWITNTAVNGTAILSVAPAAIWSLDSDCAAEAFCEDLSEAVKSYAVSKQVRRGVISTTVELIHNIQSHSGGRFAAATALLHPRRRPKSLQVAVADDGIGIPGAILSEPVHQWMSWFPDASLTEVVLGHALTGRACQSGGGMARHVRRLVGECRCRIDIRTGSSHLTLTSDKPSTFRKTHLNSGVGTQVRLEVRLE